MRKRSLAAASAVLVVLAASVAFGQSPAITPDEAYAIGTQAYLFAYPLVLMERTRHATNRPVNQFIHAPVYPTPQARTVVRPNVDTLYSTAWLDLSREPIVLSVPDMGDRYYLVQLLDAWTETFSVPGTRTTGNRAGKFAITGPDWNGTVPEGVTRIASPTNTAWIIGRIQTNGAEDYPAVRALQRGFQLTTLSGAVPPAPAAPVASEFGGRSAGLTPPQEIATQDAAAFFSAFADALAANRPHPDDDAFVARFKSIGIVAGQPFNPASLSPALRQALDRAVKDAQQNLSRQDATTKNGWSFANTIGRYGTSYLIRAGVARRGLGALPPEDAIYPMIAHDADGRPLSGAARYVVHIARPDLPPVRAFWSLTLYDADGYFVANPINRYAIGDRDRLHFNDDGSLDIYIQHERPAETLAPNWLPAPAGDFNLALRLYWPKPEALSGAWVPPAVRRQ